MPRRLKVVALSIQSSRFQGLLDSGVVSNLFSCHFVETLELKVNATSKYITVANGPVSDTLGVFKSLPISLRSLNVALNFLVVEKPPHNVIRRLPSLKALQGCLEYGTQTLTLKDNKKLKSLHSKMMWARNPRVFKNR